MGNECKVREDLKITFDKNSMDELKKLLGRQLELLSKQSEKTDDTDDLCYLSNAMATIVSVYPLTS